MDAQKKADLMKKFIKQTTLIIDSVEDDSSENTQMLKLNLKEVIPQIKGSNVVGETGMDLIVREVTSLLVAGDDVEKFWENCEQEGDILKYTGPMKLDVSKPNGRVNNRTGEFEMTKPARAWLTVTAFNRKGAGLIADKQKALGEALVKLFGGNQTAAAAAVTTAKTITPVSAAPAAAKVGP